MIKTTTVKSKTNPSPGLAEAQKTERQRQSFKRFKSLKSEKKNSKGQC